MSRPGSVLDEEERVVPSGNGFDVLENFTAEVYGDRGRYRYNLERYFQSDEWGRGCRHVETEEQVPLITEKQIKRQIRREEAMRAKASRMQKYVMKYAGRVSEEDFYAIAADMGLAPSPCRWEETLFPHVVDLWVSSEKDAEEIQRLARENKHLIACMGNIMMDALSDRQIISYDQPGTGRRRELLFQGYARNFYRGENAFYGQSRPSMFRSMPADPKEALIHRLISFTRICEFGLWLEKMGCVRDWPFGHVFHGAIAQHYGIPTNGLDITSDVKVALFFACCTFDKKSGRWRPLHSKEFARAGSRPDVARLGGDSRYGMIFCAPADVSFMSKELDDPRLHLSCPTPVGYQPFMRCERQSAYIIEAGFPYDLYLDETFSKFKFRLTEKLCRWIYREMDGGKAIYPNEGLTDSLSVIDDMIRLSEYARASVEWAIKTYQLDISVEEAIAELEKRGHHCRQEVNWCSEETLARVSAQYSRVLRSVEKSYPTVRPKMVLPGNMLCESE